jgi:hypothetical protein
MSDERASVIVLPLPNNLQRQRDTRLTAARASLAKARSLAYVHRLCLSFHSRRSHDHGGLGETSFLDKQRKPQLRSLRPPRDIRTAR